MKRPIQELEAAKAVASSQFGNVQGVEGFGIGDDTIRIYVRNPEVRKQLPEQVRGVPVDCVVTGNISADW
jgi:hypothetical protein